MTELTATKRLVIARLIRINRNERNTELLQQLRRIAKTYIK